MGGFACPCSPSLRRVSTRPRGHASALRCCSDPPDGRLVGLAGETDEDKANNAKYCISVARKLGAAVFLTFEDIVEVKSKMIMTFVASIWATSLQRRS